MGEPINPEAWRWFATQVGAGRCHVLDTFWQTETGGYMIAPLPGVTPLVAGSCTLPLPGIEAAIVDESGCEVPNGNGGLLVIKRPGLRCCARSGAIPSAIAPATSWKSWAASSISRATVDSRRPDGLTITGRMDDVLNVCGHRMGTMEIESAPATHPEVAEAAVVGSARVRAR